MHTFLFSFVFVWLYYQLLVVYVIDLPIFFRVTSLVLGQSYDCPNTNEVTLKDMVRFVSTSASWKLIMRHRQHPTTMKHNKVWAMCSTHWGWEKRATIFQTTFSNAFFSMKMFEFRLKFHWTWFLSVQLTISHHRFRWWLGAVEVTSHYLNQWWLVYRCMYTSLCLNELIPGMYCM